MGLTFISYSRMDQDFALKLASDLRMKGIEIWFDQFDIPTGALWDTSIEVGLKQSESVILILSPHSVQSKNVLDEISYALDEKKKIIPIKLIDCDVPFRIRRYQQNIDFEKDYQKGLLALLKNLTTPVTEHKVNLLSENGNNKKRRIPFILAGILLLTIAMLILFCSQNYAVDSDGDTFKDKDDGCPYEYNLYNNGCPTKTANDLIFAAAQGIKAVSPISIYPLIRNGMPDYRSSFYKRQLLGTQHIKFDKNGAYTSGKYFNLDDESNDLFLTDNFPASILNTNQYAISLNFRTDGDKSMPIIYESVSCREIGIGINNTHKVFLSLNGREYSSSYLIESNRWYNLLIIYYDNMVYLFLNQELLMKQAYTRIDCLDKYQKSGLQFSSFNFGNTSGLIFKGWWKDFQIINIVSSNKVSNVK